MEKIAACFFPTDARGCNMVGMVDEVHQLVLMDSAEWSVNGRTNSAYFVQS